MNARIIFPAMLMLALPAVADSGVRPWLSGTIGPNSYLMSDVNHAVRTANAGLEGTNERWDEITTGLGLGVALGFEVADGFSLGLGYDRHAARSELGTPAGAVEFDVPAQVLRGFGRYTTTAPSRARGFVELSVGRVSTAGEQRLLVPGEVAHAVDVEGSGPLFEGSVGGEYELSPWLALSLSAGGRQAKSFDVNVDGRAALTPTGRRLTVDHGGAFVRAGVTLSLVR